MERMAAYGQKHAGEEKQGESQYAAVVRGVLLPTIETEIAKVAELGAPEGDEEQIEAILAARQEAVDEVAKLNDFDQAEYESHFLDADKLTRAYGFVDFNCTNSIEPGAGS